MTSRERFKETLNFGQPDRVPFLEEGIRDEVFNKWNISPQKLRKQFNIDIYKFLMPFIDPVPEPRQWPQRISEIESFRKSLNPDHPSRFGNEWRDDVKDCERTDIIRILRVHRGFFLSMGVGDWKRFEYVINLLLEDSNFVQGYMQMYGEFVAQVLEKALHKVDVDAVYFSEPIGGKYAPLISPQMYHEVILKSYIPALKVLKDNKIDTFIFLSYSNIRDLIPMLLDAGFNCLWACETDSPEMDYRSIRKEYGHDLSLIGGIELDVFTRQEDVIKQELNEKVFPLLADGGYIPLADGRVRENISLEKYMNYRRILSNIINGN